jgi:hypothetical protein
MFIFFHIVFFLVKYLILLMFCFIMYWSTDNSDILRLYNGGSGGIVTQQSISNFHTFISVHCQKEKIFKWNQIIFKY